MTHDPTQEHPIANDDSAANNTASEPTIGLPVQTVHRMSTNIAAPKRRRRWVGWLTFVVAASATVWWFRGPLRQHLSLNSQSTDAPTDVPTQKSVFALGRLEPEGEVIEVAGPSGSTDARVELLNVEVGDTVQQGRVLATLDNYNRLCASVAVAQSRLTQAEKQLGQTRVNVQSLRDELHAALESQQAQLRNAEADFARQKNLVLTGAISQQEFDRASLAVETELKQVREAESRLSKYAGGVDEAIDVQVAKSNVDVAAASLQEAKAFLEQSVVIAPVSGSILDIDLRAGERIGQSTLLKMGRTKSMMVRAEVYESDVAKIEVGVKTNIHAPVFLVPLSGRVETISNYVQRQSIMTPIQPPTQTLESSK